MEINGDKDVESKLIHEFHCRVAQSLLSVKTFSAHHPIFFWANVYSTTVTSLHSLISLRFNCLTNG